MSSLPKLQKEIIKNLAMSGPSTINGISKALSKDYKAVHTAWSSLQKKELLRVSGEKWYRQRKFKEYWLTEKGVLEAIRMGVPIKLLITEWNEIYPNNQKEEMNLLNDLVDELGEAKVRLIASLFLEEKDPLNIKFNKYFDEQDFKHFLYVAYKYPTYRRLVKKARKAFNEFFDELEKSL